MYLGLRNYTNNLLGHGFTSQDIAEGGSDRLIDFLNKELVAMEADGALAKLQEKWFGMEMTLPQTIPVK